MSIDFIVGPAVDVTALAQAADKTEDEFLYNACGMPRDPQLDEMLDEADDGDIPEGYLDELFWTYANEHLKEKYGVDAFSYHDIASSGHWYVYCPARDVYDSGEPFSKFMEILRKEFGEDVPIVWLEDTRW